MANLQDICLSLAAMREGCHPFIFYHRVRPFLSGWKHNPTLPNGLYYRGVSDKPLQYYGGSAAQSSLIALLDIGLGIYSDKDCYYVQVYENPFFCFILGISHDSIRSKEFLLAMRDYMVKTHSEFLSYLETVACIREFVVSMLYSKGIPYVNLQSTDEKKTVDPEKVKKSQVDPNYHVRFACIQI